jgi:hypothetical protein
VSTDAPGHSLVESGLDGACNRLMNGRPRVVVAGGGVPGLETVLALRALAGDSVSLHLISPGEDFVYRPLEAVEPFDARAIVRFPWARILHDRGISHAATAAARGRRRRSVHAHDHVGGRSIRRARAGPGCGFALRNRWHDHGGAPTVIAPHEVAGQ